MIPTARVYGNEPISLNTTPLDRHPTVLPHSAPLSSLGLHAPYIFYSSITICCHVFRRVCIALDGTVLQGPRIPATLVLSSVAHTCLYIQDLRTDANCPSFSVSCSSVPPSPLSTSINNICSCQRHNQHLSNHIRHASSRLLVLVPLSGPSPMNEMPLILNHSQYKADDGHINVLRHRHQSACGIVRLNHSDSTHSRIPRCSCVQSKF